MGDGGVVMGDRERGRNSLGEGRWLMGRAGKEEEGKERIKVACMVMEERRRGKKKKDEVGMLLPVKLHWSLYVCGGKIGRAHV